MADLTRVLGGPWSPPVDVGPAPLPVEVQFKNAVAESGLDVPDQIIIDGRIHRFRSGNSRKTLDRSGWYVAYGEGIPSITFGCWRANFTQTFKADIGKKRWTPAQEMAHVARVNAAKKLRDAEVERDRSVAASTVETIWSEGAAASPDHPYLKRKGIQPHGAKITGDGRLMVPLFSPDGELSSLQYIDSEGGKLYHSGGQTGGQFWVIGLNSPGTLYVAEGFATAATIHEVTGRPCVVAYSASNLIPVTGSLLEIYPGQKIVIVADHDKSGVGQRHAEQACAKYGVSYVMPSVEGDANDYHQAGHNLSLLLNPPQADVFTRLKVVWCDQLGTDYEAPNELIEGLIVQGSLTVTYGDSNSGKTFFALAMAAHVAMGQEFWGRQVDPGLVVYLASEAPGSIRSRMQALKKFYDNPLSDFVMVPVPMNFYESDKDSDEVIQLVQEITKLKEKPVRLIIGDTLARMSAGANENSGEDMGPVMARFDRLAQSTQAAVHIIHHNGKDQAKGARGWSGIRAHIDTEIEVTEKDGIRSASITKQRELSTKGESIYFKLEVIEMGTTKFGKSATTCVAVFDPDSAEAKPHKKPSKHDENVRTFQRAWKESGKETRDGKPYLSRSALREILIKDGASERTAKNKTESSRNDGLIAPLLNAGLIEPFEHGWVVVNEVQASAMMLPISAPKRP